jgi:maltose alpha-D-glucosyltransferase/alpha-amylase
MYRKIDRALNPDLEISRYLSETVGFGCVPAFAGAVSLQTNGDPIALGMMQLIPESRGDGHRFMLERINNYIERILARDLSALNTQDRQGSLAQPVSVDEIPAELEDLLGVRAAEQVRVIGHHIGEMHLALSSGKEFKDFAPEEFSLHYQRSLFSGMQALVRENYQIQQRNLNRLSNDVREELESIIERKEDILNVLKRIYDKKLDATKTRIHGNLQLNNILLTGKDMVIQDFGGDATRSYSERRLKRSPLRDVVTMIRSFYYVAHEGFSKSLQLSEEEKKDTKRYADFWAYYMSSFFLKAYLDTVRGSALVPQQPDDLEMMIETYLLERAVVDLSYELNHRPDWVQVPLRMITSIINK